MSGLMRDLVCSPASSGRMTNTSTPIDHFERELHRLSRSSSGRRLLALITEKGLNPAGAADLADLAAWLQTPGFTTDKTLVGVTRLARVHRDLAGIVVVALAPTLRHRVERAARHRGGASFLSDFATGLLHTVDEMAEIPVIWSREEFVNRVLAASRRAEGRATREVPSEPLTPAADRVDSTIRESSPEEVASDARWNALLIALSLRQIDWSDFVIYQLTLTGEASIAEVAANLGIPYDTVNKRRQRTAKKVQSIIESAKVD